MTDVRAWQARHVPLVPGNVTPAIRILAASLNEGTARAVLASELRHRADAALYAAAASLGREESREHLADVNAFNHAANAVEYGVNAVELHDDRYELTQATQRMTTPTDTE